MPSITAGSYSAEQNIGNPAELIASMTNFSGTGARLILTAGQTYPSNFGNLGTITDFLTIEGSAAGDGSGGQGAIIQITGVGSANANALQYITFRRITFTTSGVLVGTPWLNGSNNLHVLFEDCDFVDFVPNIVLNSGDDLRFYRCRFLQSSAPPAAMNPTILAPGGLVIVKDCIVNWNVHSKGGTGLPGQIALIGSDSSYSSSPSPGPWWIENTQFLPYTSGTNFSADAAIDIGNGGNASLHAWIVGNVFRNCKIYLINADDVWICRNTHIIDTAYAGPTDASFITSVPATGTASPLGEIHIEENSILDLVTSGTPTQSSTKLNLQRNGYVRALYLHRNQIYYSTLPGGAAVGVVRLNTLSPNSTGWGLASICDNTFGCVDAGGTPLPAIHFDGIAAAVFDRIRVRGSRGIGTGPATGVLPATVAAGYTYLLDVGASGTTTTVDDLSIEDNDLGSSSSLTNRWYNLAAGSAAFSRSQWRKNYPREANDTVTGIITPFTYTHGTTNLHTAGRPSSGPANATFFQGNTGTGGSITLNGGPILGSGIAYNLNLLLMIGDVVVVTTGAGGTLPSLWITPPESTL
jgi:hypothetical protein